MTALETSLARYLRPTRFIDFEHPSVSAFVREVVGNAGELAEQVVALYYAVRDGIRYDPYRIDLSPDAMTASSVLEKKYGFCIPKATLLAAAARAVGIPSRLGFADVRNHLATERLLRVMQTDVFAYHGYTELYIEDRWVKVTPAFNASLCERFDVAPLEFDGNGDALLQEFDRGGNRYMEYLRDHGTFADLPLRSMIAAFRRHYPALMTANGYELSGRFEDDAVTSAPRGD